MRNRWSLNIHTITVNRNRSKTRRNSGLRNGGNIRLVLAGRGDIDGLSKNMNAVRALIVYTEVGHMPGGIAGSRGCYFGLTEDRVSHPGQQDKSGNQ